MNAATVHGQIRSESPTARRARSCDPSDPVSDVS